MFDDIEEEDESGLIFGERDEGREYEIFLREKG